MFAMRAVRSASKHSIKVHSGRRTQAQYGIFIRRTGRSPAALKSCEPQIVTEAIHDAFHRCSICSSSGYQPHTQRLLQHVVIVCDTISKTNSVLQFDYCQVARDIFWLEFARPSSEKEAKRAPVRR